MSKSRLDTVLEGMPDYSDLSNQDLKTLIAEFIMSQPDDDVEKSRGTRSRLKLDALKLLAEIVKSESGGDINDAILGIIAGKKAGDE